MRYLFTCFLAAVILSGCKSNDKNGAVPSPGDKTIQRDSSQFTTIQWLDSVKDFGKIREGQKLEVTFRFKNSGDKPLVIERVQPSCGCTVAEQSKEPVAPGQEGQIRATFNSEGKTGINHKTLNVFANTRENQNHSLVFTVEVEKK